MDGSDSALQDSLAEPLADSYMEDSPANQHAPSMSFTELLNEGPYL